MGCTIGCLIAEDAQITKLELTDCTIGSPEAGQAQQPGGLLAPWRSFSSPEQLSELMLVKTTLNQKIDFTGRRIRTSLMLRGVTFNAPLHVTRNSLAGDIDIEGVITGHESTNDTPTLRRWVRMFSELKRSALSVGDRFSWADFAIREQEARLRQSDSFLNRFVFKLDGIISEHGTDWVQPLVMLFTQVFIFGDFYVLIDVITGRMAAYREFYGFVTAKFMFSISQTVRPFSAFEEEFMGHPYLVHVADAHASGVPLSGVHAPENWLHPFMLTMALIQSGICITIAASALLALRHRVSSAPWEH
jgi:hypothetical protein